MLIEYIHDQYDTRLRYAFPKPTELYLGKLEYDILVKELAPKLIFPSRDGLKYRGMTVHQTQDVRHFNMI